MKKLFWLLPAVLLLAVGCGSPAANNTVGSNSAAITTAGSPAATSPQKFSDQPYYGNSYLISGGTLSAEAQIALAGFTLNKQTLPDGTTQINLSSTNPEYQSQQYLLKPGQQLYFIERTSGDDSGNQERNLGDDSAVVVDSQGFLVQ